MKLDLISENSEGMAQFSISDTTKDPKDINIEVDGFEENITQYVQIKTIEGEVLEKLEVDSIAHELLTNLKDHGGEYIIKVDDKSVKKSIDNQIVTDILNWVSA